MIAARAARPSAKESVIMFPASLSKASDLDRHPATASIKAKLRVRTSAASNLRCSPCAPFSG
jgi:hypothetical protein